LNASVAQSRFLTLRFLSMVGFKAGPAGTAADSLKAPSLRYGLVVAADPKLAGEWTFLLLYWILFHTAAQEIRRIVHAESSS
jgi:hypothetical protein